MKNPFRTTWIVLLLRAAAIALSGCLAGLLVNAARPAGLPLVLRTVTCPGVPLEWWAYLIHGQTLQPAAALWKQREAVFVDARDHTDYIYSHIPGALELPYHDYDRASMTIHPLLLHDDPLVVYGDGQPCGLALRVAKRLQQIGMHKVMILDGGFPAWEQAGLPVQRGHQRGSVGVTP
ncbi:MAG TPA: rhodanese-like domain-containing protein [Armatimonadota bacterium]|jgi:3-mercaptopyruvate sulfurtransferase SseA